MKQIVIFGALIVSLGCLGAGRSMRVDNFNPAGVDRNLPWFIDFKYGFGSHKETTTESGRKEITIERAIPEKYLQLRDGIFYVLKGKHQLPIQIGEAKGEQYYQLRINPMGKSGIYVHANEGRVNAGAFDYINQIEVLLENKQGLMKRFSVDLSEVVAS